MAFAEKLKNDKEKEGFTNWALKGTIHSNFAHLLPRSREAGAPPSTTVAHNESAAPVLLKQVPLQKEMLVSMVTEDAPKTPAITNCPEALV